MNMPLSYDKETKTILDAGGRSIADLYNDEFAETIINAVNGYEDLEERLEITKLHKEDIYKAYEEKSNNVKTIEIAYQTALESWQEEGKKNFEEISKLKYIIFELTRHIKYTAEIDKRNGRNMIAKNAELLLKRLNL